MSANTPLLFPSFFSYALRRLLVVLSLGDGVAQLLRQVVHERQHAVALPLLLLIRAPSLRRRRRRVPVPVHGAHLGEAHRARVRLAVQHRFLQRRGGGRGLLVLVRAVELVQAVLRLLDELQRRVVLLRERQELLVLLLALARGVAYGLVQLLHLGLQAGHLRGDHLHALLRLGDERAGRLHLPLEVLLLVRARGEVLVAEALLRVVRLLLALQDAHHVLDHLDDLREVHGLRLQRVGDQRELRAVRRLRREGRDEVVRAARALDAGALLQQALLRERERLLEEVQGIVIVEDLNRLADARDLLRARLRAHVPLLLLRAALRGEVREEGLRLAQLLGGVLNVVLPSRDGHRQGAGALGLGLDRGARGRDLRLLRRLQVREAARGLLLVRDRAVQVLVHVLLHRLQDAHDLARLAAVGPEGVLRASQEGQHALALDLVEARALHDGREALAGARLQQGLAHA